jgi:glycogen synthase
MSRLTGRPLRIAYLSGPTDAEGILRELREGKEPNYFGTNYMRQFLLFADEIGAEALIATWNDGPASERSHGRYTFVNRPPARGSGASWHLAQLRQQLAFLRRFMSFRPDVLLLTGNQDFWWVYVPLKLLGTRFVASFHGVIWPKFREARRHQKVLLGLNKRLALPLLDAAVLTSEDIRAQLEQALGPKYAHVPVFNHLPSYDDRKFAGITPVDGRARTPFGVMFMGRVEENKGVFDIVEIASQLEREHPGKYRFDICGSGSDLQRLRDAIASRALDELVACHGYCGPDSIREVMSRSHAVIVPTRKDFDAGFEMTCAEAILGGRPLITSAVCPALHYLKDASVEVEPENIAQYRQAIERLAGDAEFYNSKVDACAPLREQFLSPENSWDAAIRKAFEAIAPTRVAGKSGFTAF